MPFLARRSLVISAKKLKASLVIAAAFVTVIASGLAYWSPTFGPRQRSPASAKIVEPAHEDPNPWPGPRGQHHTGIASDVKLIEKWKSEGPPILWRRPLGQGYSGFVANGSRVFTAYQTLAGQYVICLEANSGNTIWEYRCGWPFEATGLYPGPRATPTLDNGRLFYAAPNGWLGCFDQSNGRLHWHVNLKEKFAGRGTDFGYSCAPTVFDNMVVLPVGGEDASVVALDAATGNILWKVGNDPASYSPILPIQNQGERQLVAFLQNAIIGLEARTGAERWRYSLSRGYDEHATYPIWSEPNLLITRPFRAGADLLKLTKTEIKTVWHSPAMSNDVFSSVLIDNHIYGFDLRDVQAKVHRPSRGSFRCLDFTTGKVKWSADSTGHASVIAADGKLILCNDLGEVILLRCNLEKFEELARSKVLGGKLTWQQPALHHGNLYLRNHEEAVCLSLRPKAELDQMGIVPLVDSKPAPTPFDLSTMLGIEREYAFDVPDVTTTLKWFTVSAIAVILPTLIIGRFLERILGPNLALGIETLLMAACGVAVTLISAKNGEFIFTWPVTLFAIFRWTVHELPAKSAIPLSRREIWRSRFAAAIFLLCCACYYWICRRLSLAAEWGYLIGFPAALPFLVLEAKKRNWLWTSMIVVLAFATYFWCSYGVVTAKQNWNP